MSSVNMDSSVPPLNLSTAQTDSEMSNERLEQPNVELRSGVENINICVEVVDQLNSKDVLSTVADIEKVANEEVVETLTSDFCDDTATVIKIDNKNSYSCDVCDKKCDRLAQLRAHKKMAHKSNAYDCDKCSESYKSDEELSENVMKTKSGKQTSVCIHCGDTLNSYSDYKAHVKLHGAGMNKKYKCELCNLTFGQKSYLEVHYRNHSGEKPYRCDYCDSSFKQLSHLTTHKRTHTLEKPFMCNLCPAKFSQSGSLKRHIRSHTGDKPYSCSMCELSFSDKRNLTRHILTHKGIRPYKCTQCGASFTQMVDLSRHQMSHSGIKPFKCDLCNASFSRNSNLKWHKLTHEGDTPYNCATCAVGFRNLRDLKQHLRNHSSIKLVKCNVCNTSLSGRFGLLRHAKIHTGCRPFKCSQCDSAFLEKSSLKRHEHRHKGVKPHKCDICSSSFFEVRMLKRHKVTVHGEKRFSTEETMEEFIKNDGSNSSADKRNENKITTAPLQSTSQESVPQSLTENQHHVNDDIVSGDPLNLNGSGPAYIDIPDTVENNETTLLLSNHGEAPKVYRLAGDCQNHQHHVFTFLEGNSNQWQSWCFCSPPNIGGNNPTPSSNSGIPPGSIISVQNCAQSNLEPQQQQTTLISNTQYITDVSNQQNCNMNDGNVCNENTILPHFNESKIILNQQQEVTPNFPNQTTTAASQVYTISNSTVPIYSDSTQVLTIDNPNHSHMAVHNEARNLQQQQEFNPIQLKSERAGTSSIDVELKPQTINSLTTGEKSTSESVSGANNVQYNITVNNPTTGNIQVATGVVPFQGSNKESIGESKKKFKCSTCHKSFSRRMHLEIHQRKHTGEKPFQCTICKMTFPHNNTLTSHMRSHTGERPYSCGTCNASFAQKSNLTAHMRIHTGEKPYRCDICDMTFRQASHLPSHRRTHNNERPYACKLCCHRFTQNSALKRHMKTHNAFKADSYVCVMCDLTFKGEHDWFEHQSATHPETLHKCSLEGCQKKFDNLKVGQKTYTADAPNSADNVSVKREENRVEILVEATDSLEDQNEENMVYDKPAKDSTIVNKKKSKLQTRLSKGLSSKSSQSPRAQKKSPKAICATPTRSSTRLRECTSKRKKNDDFITEEDFPDLDDIYLEEEPRRKIAKMKSKNESEADSVMKSWCFCEIPHESHEPHNYPSTSQTAPVISKNNIVPTSSMPTTIIYSSSESVDDLVHSSFSTNAPLCKSNQHEHYEEQQQTYAIIDANGEVKTINGEMLDARAMTAANELLTMSQTAVIGNDVNSDDTVFNSNKQLINNGERQNLSPSDSYHNLRSNFHQATIGSNKVNPIEVLSTDGEILSVVQDERIYVSSSGEDKNNFIVSDPGPNKRMIQVQNLRCDGSSTFRLEELQRNIQIVGTVSEDGRMELYHNNSSAVLSGESSSTGQQMGIKEEGRGGNLSSSTTEGVISNQFGSIEATGEGSQQHIHVMPANGSTIYLEAAPSIVYQTTQQATCDSNSPVPTTSVSMPLTFPSESKSISNVPVTDCFLIPDCGLPLVSNSNQTTLLCPLCAKHFSRQTKALEHHLRQAHLNVCPSPAICFVCFTLFSSRDLLNCHTKEKHMLNSSKAAISCPDCSIPVSSMEALREHNLQYHNTVIPQQQVIVEPSPVTVLPQVVQSAPPPVDDDSMGCTMSIPQLDSSAIHEMTSLDSNQSSTVPVLSEWKKISPEFRKSKAALHECNFCSEKFTAKSDLERHKLQHTGEKPFQCSVCDAQFTRQSSLNKHQRIHTGQKPYVCEQCHSAFSYKYQLNKHKSRPCIEMMEDDKNSN